MQKCGVDFALGGFGGVAMQEIGFKAITSTICAPESTFQGLIANPGHSQQKRAQETSESSALSGNKSGGKVALQN